MVIPGLLVEYLVTGAVAIIWIYPIFAKFFPGDITATSAIILSPSIYVIGMFVDFIAFLAVSYIPHWGLSLKAQVRQGVQKKADLQDIDENVFQIGYGRSSRSIIMLYEKGHGEVVKEIQSRSSRDRIARGNIINIIAIWMVYKVTNIGDIGLLSGIPNIIWMMPILFCVVVWAFFERSSYGFELRVGDVLNLSPKR